MCKRLIYLISVLVLSFTCTSYADVVIGDFEGSMDGWDLTWEGTSTIALSNIGATSGSQSLALTGPTNAFSWAVMREGLVDPANYHTISADITWVASEWDPQSGIWVNFKELAVNSDGPSGWAQYIPTDVVNPDWPGSWDPANWGDQTRTLTWDISNYDATGATWMQIIFSTNMGGVTTAGNYYIDNVKLIGEEPEPAPPAGPNIVWVTETCDDDLDGIQDDQAWIDWLAAEGYTVDVRIDYWLEFDASKVDELNAADLVIVSRSATSGGYVDGDEPTLWNSVTTPLITFNVHLTRSNRWLWINSTGVLHLSASMMTALVLDHPIFDGVTLDANNQVQVLNVAVGSGLTSFIDTLDVGNGILIAQSADQLPWIAEWEAGVEFYEGAGQIPGGKRMIFMGGTQEDTTAGAEKPQGAMNLTVEGQQIFLNAINYLVPGVAPEAPSPVAHWQFDEGSGTVAADSSGNGHDGTVLGTPEWGPGPEGFGGALNFKVTRGANCGDFDPTGGTGVFTLTLWCLWDGTTGTQHFLTKSNGWAADTMMFQVEVKGGHSNPDRTDRFALAYQGATQAIFHVVPKNEWVHMALVFDGTNATGYLNGVDEVGPQPTGIGGPVAGPVWIGVAHNDKRVFQGWLDDMRVYDIPLTEAEIAAIASGQ